MTMRGSAQSLAQGEMTSVRRQEGHSSTQATTSYSALGMACNMWAVQQRLTWSYSVPGLVYQCVSSNICVCQTQQLQYPAFALSFSHLCSPSPFSLLSLSFLSLLSLALCLLSLWVPSSLSVIMLKCFQAAVCVLILKWSIPFECGFTVSLASVKKDVCLCCCCCVWFLLVWSDNNGARE